MNLIPRSTWGARPADPPLLDMDTPAPETWIHHAAFSLDDEEEMMRDIQLAHQHMGYRDFAYNFGVGQSGTIYEGRGWGKTNGADGSDHDLRSHTWCFLGNANVTEPSPAVVEALREHIGIGLKGGYIKAGVNPTGGHRDIDATSCPGDKLYAKLDDIRVPWSEKEADLVWLLS